MAALEAGDRFPPIVGGFVGGGFFSIDDFAGRTLVLLVGETTLGPVMLDWLGVFAAAKDTLAECEGAACGLISMAASAFSAVLGAGTIEGLAVAAPSANLSALAARPEAPDLVVIDRNSRVYRILRRDDPQAALSEALEAVRSLTAPPEAVRPGTPAPILVVPYLISDELRLALIKAHEDGATFQSGMASIDAQGNPVMKMEDGKKRRRDLLLEPDHPLHGAVLAALSNRLVPEIKRAFQIDIAHCDRILIACYDESGGYFLRHRDNAAPQVAFRQFAVSLNLNTGSYEGGELEFPEFGNDLYLPPAGAAVVFSATLLHAARPVKSGRRYVLLTFVHDANAEMFRQNLAQAGA